MLTVHAPLLPLPPALQAHGQQPSARERAVWPLLTFPGPLPHMHGRAVQVLILATMAGTAEQGGKYLLATAAVYAGLLPALTHHTRRLLGGGRAEFKAAAAWHLPLLILICLHGATPPPTHPRPRDPAHAMAALVTLITGVVGDLADAASMAQFLAASRRTVGAAG